MESPFTYNLEFFTNLEESGNPNVITWCQNNGLLPSKYTCPSCGKNMELQPRNDIIDSFAWICRKDGPYRHSMRISIRKGTIFEGSRLTLGDILRFAYLWVFGGQDDLIKNEISSVNHKNFLSWIKIFRNVCVEACIGENRKLGGPGVTVEIYECVFGKGKYVNDSRFDGQWVIGGIERISRDFFIEIVDEKNKEILLEVMKKYILDGTAVISDCWKAYNCQKDRDFMKFISSHNLKLKESKFAFNERAVERLFCFLKQDFSHLKLFKPTEYFDAYMAEYFWRTQYKLKPDERFNSFLAAVRATYRPGSIPKNYWIAEVSCG